MINPFLRGAAFGVRTDARRALALAGVCAGMGVAACDSAPRETPTVVGEQAAPAYLGPREWNNSTRPVTEMLVSPRGSLGDPVLVGRQRLSASGGANDGLALGVMEPEPGELVTVRMAVSGAEIREVIQAVLGELLGRSFVVDAGVQGLVSLEIDEQFTRAEALDLVGGLLSLYNCTMDERDGVFYIRPMAKVARSPDAPVLQARPGVESDFSAVRVRRTRYIAPEQLSTMLREFASEGGRIAHVGRTLVIADTARQVARLSTLISAMDVPAFGSTEIWTYRLANRSPAEAVALLEAITNGSAINAGPEPLVSFIPVPGSNRLMVIARDPTTQPMVTDFIRQADQSKGSEERGRFIYRVQHYPTTQLNVLVRDFFGEKMERNVGEGVDARIRMIPDGQSDLLLIYATPSDYAELLSVFRAVDRPPQQVQVRSIIAEVRLAKRLQYGVEYFLELNAADLGELALTGATGLPSSASPTGTAFFIGTDGFAIIQALDRESDARILSQPRLVIRDRETGSIQVGGEVPVLRASEGSSTQTGGTSAIREEIEYRETGVILTIQPEINESGLITLKIAQEVNDALPTDVPNQPEFTTRKIETTVVVPHGQTVLLGGIIIEDRRDEQNRIPILGRIPVLGEAFKNRNDTVQRTELVLAITPTIINEPGQMRGSMGEFLRSAYSVRSALHEFSNDLPRGALEEAAPEGLEDLAPEPDPAPESEVDRAQDLTQVEPGALPYPQAYWAMLPRAVEMAQR